MIEAFRNVLFLGAHPDDEMACAGTLSRLAASGADVAAVAFSDCADLIPVGFTVDDLMNEWRTATAMLGITDLTLRDVPNRLFPEHRQEVLDYLIERRADDYDLVLVPASSDCHQDHSTVREEAIRAFKHTTILGYEHPQNTVRAAILSAYVALDPADVRTKVRHARTYQSQALRTYTDEKFIRGVAAMRGVQANTQWAEAFEVIRWILK